ncbi:MAG TPA: LysR family transcriptional regulator [Candidatus Binatia bacterium]|nr:LysR family transcriptional regulator [Candidatus Binatia bacterium]
MPAAEAEARTDRRPARPPGRVRARPDITLDQLHTFLAVAERQHIHEASAALGVSQGSVSSVVRRLERAVGLPLFQRVGRNIRLTDAGRSLRPIATRVFDDLAQVDELRSSYLDIERGEIAIAAGNVVGAHRVPGWLAPFVAAHPEIGLHLTLAPYRGIISMLQDGDADIVFAGWRVDVPGLQSLVLERSEMLLVVAAGHPLARSRAPLRELSRHRHLVHARGSATRRLADLLLAGHAQDAETVELGASAMVSALMAGLGFAVIARVLVERDLESGRLVALPSRGPRVMQEFSAARRIGAHMPAVDLLWEHLQGLAGVTPPAAPPGRA